MAIRETLVPSFEIGVIRPPSEAYSLLIRVTRNCPWNRCQFCRTYKGQKFQLRPVAEIKQDIKTAKAIQDEIKGTSWKSGYRGRVKEIACTVLDNPPNAAYYNVALWLCAGGESTFLQDANALIMKTSEMVEVIRFLKQNLPGIKRVTSYARSKTVAKKTLEELKKLKTAGLSRLHIGLESGYDPLLKYMDKGVTAAENVAAGKKVVESGISLCEYVILGLGGKKMWREHATETARVLNEIDPDYIRVRTLSITSQMPLYSEIENGNFVRATDEEIIEEEKLLIEHLNCHSSFVSDHITNLFQEIEGKLPQDKEKMLATLDRFQSLSPEERQNFIVGRRVGTYRQLNELSNSHKHKAVEQIIHELGHGNDQIDSKTIYALMESFI
ncbi:radical SAM protein [Chloroflexota bacterium]